MRTRTIAHTLVSAFTILPSALAFEGRIITTLTRGGETQTVQYTVGPHQLRLDRTETNWPHAKNIVSLDTGAVTLVFPHNRTFVRLKNRTGSSPASPGAEGTTGSPSHIAPPPPMLAGIGPTNLPGIPTPPPMQQSPAIPTPPAGLPPGIGPQPSTFQSFNPSFSPFPTEQAELKATGEMTNLLGYACTRYELKQGNEVMEIWATDKLVPYYAWLANQASPFGPRMMEEQWPEMLKARKLFPLLAILKFENGPDRLRFEVKSLKKERITDAEGKPFQPPADYHELEPLPF